MKFKSLFVLVGLLTISPQSYSINISELYSSALINDPEFQVAIKEKDAALQNKGINRSFLLPNLSYGYYTAYNQQNLTVLQSGQSGSTPYYYSSVVDQLILNQTIFNYAQYANYRKGIAQAAFGLESYKSKAQSLGIRLLTAYFDVLYAQDQIKFLESQIKALTNLSKINKKALELGQAAKTDFLETDSRLEIAKSQLLEAHGNHEINLRTLQSITGFSVTDLKENLDPLAKDFRFFPVDLNLKDAEQMAIEINPEILAAKQAMEAAKQDFNAKRGAYYPTLSLQATYGQNISQYISQYNQQYTGGYIGVQLTVPIFAGGFNLYSTRQAQSNFEMAEADLNLKIEKLKIDLQKQRTSLNTLRSQIQALTKAKASTEILVDANRKNILYGMKGNIDLLNSEQQLVQVSRDLAKAKYDYMVAYGKFRVALGNLAIEDLEKISQNLSISN